MAAGKYNITVEKGSSYSKKFTYKDGEGVLINLSGYTARMKAKRSKSVPFVTDTALVDMTTENGKITLGGALGTVILNLTASETAALPTCVGYYDIELIQGSNVTRFLEGEFNIVDEITK